MRYQTYCTLFFALIANISNVCNGALTHTVTPVADTFVASANPASNFGAAGGLAISALGSANGEFGSVMRFDLAAAHASFDSTFGAGNWQLTAVSLKLTTTLPNNPVFNANAAGQFTIQWMQDDSWIEGTGMPSAPSPTGLTFSALPAHLANGVAPLGTFNFIGGNSGSATYALAMQPNFANDIASGSLVSLHSLAADSAVSYLFNSRNVTNAANRPELSITADAIPEPSVLAVCTFAGLVVRRQRRTKMGG
jgi:hypothetical protein